MVEVVHRSFGSSFLRGSGTPALGRSGREHRLPTHIRTCAQGNISRANIQPGDLVPLTHSSGTRSPPFPAHVVDNLYHIPEKLLPYPARDVIKVSRTSTTSRARCYKSGTDRCYGSCRRGTVRGRKAPISGVFEFPVGYLTVFGNAQNAQMAQPRHLQWRLPPSKVAPTGIESIKIT